MTTRIPAGLKKPPALLAREDSGQERAPIDAEKAGTGDRGAGLLEGEEPAELPNETQAISLRGVGLLTASRHVGANDVQGDDGVVRREVGAEKPIEPSELPSLLAVAVPGGALELEKAPERRRHW